MRRAFARSHLLRAPAWPIRPHAAVTFHLQCCCARTNRMRHSGLAVLLPTWLAVWNSSVRFWWSSARCMSARRGQNGGIVHGWRGHAELAQATAFGPDCSSGASIPGPRRFGLRAKRSIRKSPPKHIRPPKTGDPQRPSAAGMHLRRGKEEKASSGRLFKVSV